MCKNLFEEAKDVLQELGCGVGDEVEDGRSIFGEDVRDVLGKVFADGSDHSDALVTLLPISLDEAI